MSSTSEWLHFHQNNNPNINTSSLGHVSSSYAATSQPDLFFSGLVSEATAVSTPAVPDPPQLGPAGRVTKPVRRRTRASRRTPTTMINTDTSNFRAMVQQYTGGPGSSFPALGGLGPQGFNVGPGVAPGLGYGLQYATSSNNNNSNMINANMFMQSNMMANYNNNNSYATNTGSDNYVKGGSSSSENRSSNNFQF